MLVSELQLLVTSMTSTTAYIHACVAHHSSLPCFTSYQIRKTSTNTMNCVNSNIRLYKCVKLSFFCSVISDSLSNPSSEVIDDGENPYDFRKLLRKTSQRGRLIEDD